MKIKIIKVAKGKWYHNKIGKVYHAKMIYEFEGITCYIIRNYRTILRTIDCNDAKIVEK